ncbi:unnamed protein product [Camellia sinensis]
MEAEKRKRTDDGELDGKRMRLVSEDNGIVTELDPEPEDDEVEEFYAILRRIQVAVRYFENGRGGDGGRRRCEVVAEGSSTSSAPSFERQDFAEAEAETEAEEGRVKEVEEDTGLDLNADPLESED